MAPLGLDTADPSDALRQARARERRARFTRYVSWGMGLCVLVLVAGVARKIAVAHDASAEEAPRASQAFTVAAPPPSIGTAPLAAAPAAIPVVAADALPMASNPKEAKREKKVAKSALEHRKIGAAITSATRATALDPTDAEAWLVLGAAYMEKGDTASAREAFASCGKNATHGPKRECASMMR